MTLRQKIELLINNKDQELFGNTNRADILTITIDDRIEKNKQTLSIFLKALENNIMKKSQSQNRLCRSFNGILLSQNNTVVALDINKEKLNYLTKNLSYF